MIKKIRNLPQIAGKLPFLHQHFHRLQNGYDPIDPQYASKYSAGEWSYYDAGNVARVIEKLEKRLGSLAGKRILDLGAGPGQYAVAFAQKGGVVTWHDPSRSYMGIAQAHAVAKGVSCNWSLGYLEDAAKFKAQPFDLVFCRICWYFCVSDSRMARLIFSIIKPGGAAWIDIPTSAWSQANQCRKGHLAGLANGLFYKIYKHTGIKFAYLMPEPGKITKLFCQYDMAHLEVDQETLEKELVFFIRRAELG